MKRKKDDKTPAGKKPVRNNKKSTFSSVIAVRKEGFPIVGIGASAGGLEAIEGFFANTPSDLNIAFVIIQHLAPEHKSIMGSLLEKYTKMKVVEARDGVKVLPGCVYLNPPNRDVSIMNGRLLLHEPTQPRGVHLPIDHFFRSLAEAVGYKSICIVLSGTGTDGTLGLKAIKGAGGMAMAQEESQAKYNNMPRSAIDTGLVDYVLPVEKMPAELMKYVKHPYIVGPEKVLTAKEKFESHLQKIFMLIRSATGHDFSQYKINTIRRRIERRMAVHQIDKISEYVAYLQKNPAEIKPLFKDFLITVTNFFRDPKAFKLLQDKVVSQIVKTRPNESTIRVWVAGCATGEEAYSIAILFAEAMKEQKKHFTLQIFATDIDADAIERARMGLYPDSIAADVSNERLKQFFLREENACRVKKQIREMVVFATQDLVKDAPFSKLDLVTCRNVLIYMNTLLQKRILPLFHYTLNPDGYMFLGTSETIGEFTDLFGTVDFKWKIFRRKKGVANMRIEHPALPLVNLTGQQAKDERKFVPTPVNIRQMAERTILQEYAPPCVMVDEKFDVLYFNGDTDKYLSMPTGEPSFNLLKITREDIRYQLSTLLHKCFKDKKPVESKNVSVLADGRMVPVNIIVKPLVDPAIKSEFMMVLFESPESPAIASSKRKEQAAAKAIEPRVAALEQELQSTKEYLQTTIEELETSNEELQSTNEELQSTNEELQSTNEELETSREELQSTNEELETVNAEQQNKVEELSQANNDLNNLLGCTEIATVFLDNDIRIKRYTSKTTDIFKLINSDVGRPISDIVHNLIYDDLLNDVQEILRNLGRIEKEVRSKAGSWFLMRILPYRTADNAIDGVVVTFVDITKQKNDQLMLRESEEKCSALIHQAQAGIALADADTGLIIECNPAFEKITGRDLAALKKMKIWELRPAKKAEEAKMEFDDVVKKGTGVSSELPFQRPDGRIVDIDCVNSIVIIRDKRYIQNIVRDTTQRRR
jgi:two-component system CheB/CheR fusion protein